MTFAWPWMLLSLLAVPAAAVAYRRLVRRRAARRASLAAIGLVAPEPVRMRRRVVAPSLFLGAVALLAVAVGRPAATVAEPRREGTVILAFDVSTSMAAKDLRPTRLEAAKQAARAFVRRQPSSIRLGVVAFGESGLVAQQPTFERGLVLAAIDRLQPQGGTSVGRGILTSLSAIAGRPVTVPKPSETAGPADDSLGYYGSAAVVLLSDGENTDEPDPHDLADLASSAGVRIYPIGVGSSEGTVLQVDGFMIATALHEDVLKQIAQTTNGRYFNAADTAGLARVYDSIDLKWTAHAERREVTSLFAATAALLLLIGAALSLLWFGRVV